MRTIELQDRGYGMTDYFHGTSGVFLPISIDKDSTVEDLINGIANEINMIFDHFEYTFTDIPADTLDKQLTDIIKKCRYENKDNLKSIAVPDLEYSFEDLDDKLDDSICYWFTFNYTD